MLGGRYSLNIISKFPAVPLFENICCSGFIYYFCGKISYVNNLDFYLKLWRISIDGLLAFLYHFWTLMDNKTDLKKHW